MKNNQLIPFERNRYYVGKALTSADFAAEQQYMNNKRRFMNNVMLGQGVACGLSVFNLDDLSIIIESGVAIDGYGREIVVEKSVVQKISAIEGFDSLKTDCAQLFIRYQEEDVYPVYCATASEGEADYQCNRIHEKYEFFLRDKMPEMSSFLMEDEFLIKEFLADTGDYSLELTVPSSISKNSSVKLLLTIKKLSAESKKLSFKGKFQIPVLCTEDDKHELDMDISDLMLEEGEVLVKEYWLKAADTNASEANIVAQTDSMSLYIDGIEAGLNKESVLKVMLTDLTPEEITSQELGKTSLEMRSLGAAQGEVLLAEFGMIRTEVTCLIGKVWDKEVKNYIEMPAQMKKRKEYLSYFKPAEAAKVQNVVYAQQEEDFEEKQGYRKPSFINCGTVEIPLKPNMKKNEVCISEEITHGLGRGQVYVEIGQVCTQDGFSPDDMNSCTIYGDTSLFAKSTQMNIKTAVKVNNDRGSFQVALKLLGEQRSIVLPIHWVAFKCDGSEPGSIFQDTEDMRIVAKTPTVRVGAKSNYFFDVRFENMEPCQLSYELTEVGSGEISADGVYTAPAKEGVYEIRIFCTEMPKIFTYAYAIVKR